MKNYFRNKKGFTLIELLVVVAIIGLLSSVVLASLNSARNKAKDAAIKEAAFQLATVMALNYNDYGDYCNLWGGLWINVSGTCDAQFSGTYASKAREICNNLYNNAGDWFNPGGGFKILAYTYVNPLVNPSIPDCNTFYSFAIQLNNGKWFCTGSSGAKGEYADYWSSPGCYQNP